jgi:hypothetical protein
VFEHLRRLLGECETHWAAVAAGQDDAAMQCWVSSSRRAFELTATIQGVLMIGPIDSSEQNDS